MCRKQVWDKEQREYNKFHEVKILLNLFYYELTALELLLKLSEFALPKLRAIEVNNESEEAKHTSLNINIIDTGVPLASCEADVVD